MGHSVMFFSIIQDEREFVTRKIRGARELLICALYIRSVRFTGPNAARPSLTVAWLRLARLSSSFAALRE